MRKRLLLIGATVLFVAALLPLPALAQESWTGAQSAARVDFGASITFSLQAQSPGTLSSLHLLFQLEGERARNRIDVDVPSGTRVNAQWVWELEPGAMPPGRVVSYWWRAELSDGRILQTEPATVRYDDNRFQWEERNEGNIHLRWYGSRTEADKIMAAAQTALKRLQEGTGVDVVEPVRVFLYRSKSDMQKAISSRSESYDAAILTLGMAMGGDTIVILSTASGAEQTIAHELSHIVIGRFTDNPLGGLPTWLDEGLAMYAEGELRGDNQRDLDRAIRNNTLITVRSLSAYPGDPSQVDLFYGQCYSVVEFLIDTFGSEKMDLLLQTFQTGVYQEDALQQVYGFGLDELDARWRAAIGAPPLPTPAPTQPPVLPPSRTQEPSTSTPICTTTALVLVLAGVFIWRKVA
jgi:hypothetical protein